MQDTYHPRIPSELEGLVGIMKPGENIRVALPYIPRMTPNIPQIVRDLKDKGYPVSIHSDNITANPPILSIHRIKKEVDLYEFLFS